MSDTPETDAAVKWDHKDGNQYVLADFARSLERRLTDEIAVCNHLKAEARPICEICRSAILIKGEIDRSGTEWWCPLCASREMGKGRNQKLAALHAENEALKSRLTKDLEEYKGEKK